MREKLADELIGPVAKRIMQSARQLGYEWEKLDKAIVQHRVLDLDACELAHPVDLAQIIVGERVMPIEIQHSIEPRGMVRRVIDRPIEVQRRILMDRLP